MTNGRRFFKCCEPARIALRTGAHQEPWRPRSQGLARACTAGVECRHEWPAHYSAIRHRGLSRFAHRRVLRAAASVGVGNAGIFLPLGLKALATTSAGFAFSRGTADGAVPRDEMLAHIGEIAAATSLPVNADFQDGFAEAPEGVAANTALCGATGVAG